MEQVFIVTNSQPDPGDCIIGVFSSYEEAMKCAMKFYKDKEEAEAQVEEWDIVTYKQWKKDQ